MGDTENTPLTFIVLVCSVVGLLNNLVSIFYKQRKQFSLPKLWKYAYLSIDFGHVFLSVGLILSISFKLSGSEPVCRAAGFLIVFGVFDCICGLLTAGIILFGIYNPGKSSQISTFHRNVFLLIIIPEKFISLLLSTLPLTPIGSSLFSKSLAITCVRILQPYEDGGELGLVSFGVLWVSLLVAFLTCVISAVKLWKGFSNRIHSSTVNVWQSQLVIDGKRFQRLLLCELILWLLILFLFNFVTYYDSGNLDSATWIVWVSLSLATVLHSVWSQFGNAMWSICCCGSKRDVEEPQHKLKRLELIKVEEAGKLRLKATWSVSRGTVRRGLMKVYGSNNVKAWAQEIVVLGMLRKAQHPSLLQCLWTSSSNPYYETMTLITGEIITSDSRIICLELTNNGSLEELLQKDVSLPETCQRMVVHDIAEGLFYLHSQNILHNNLSSSCIYLKGSLPNMVMRAAIGDFEHTQIYGSMQQTETVVCSKRQFFLPDIRSFALVALEIVTKSCERRFLNMQYEWDYDQDPNDLIKGNGHFVVMPSILPETHHSDFGLMNDPSDDSDIDHYVRRQPANGIRSPYEMIEEVRRRSRSMSPGSRPMSAQSRRSTRSKTVSPDRQRMIHRSPSAQSATTLFNGRSGTPEPDDILQQQTSARSEVTEVFHKRTTIQESAQERTESPMEKKKGKGKKSHSRTLEGQAFEIKGKNKDIKKSNSKRLLSKPVSILKNLTGSETTVSAFKSNDKEDSSAGEISEEEMEEIEIPFDRYKLNKKMRQDSKNSIQSFQSENSLHRTMSQKSDQWSIRSDMEYRPHGLKNTVSADSRASLWSNLPLPLESIDIERDDLDHIIDCLPGMADSLDFQRNRPKLSEILNARDRIGSRPKAYWQYDGPGPQRFELVDYYDELQGVFVKKLQPVRSLHRTSSGSQIVSLPVHRTFSGTQVLHRTNSGLQEIMEATEATDEEESYSNSKSHQLVRDKKTNKIKVQSIQEPQETKAMNQDKKSTKKKERSKSIKKHPAPPPPFEKQISQNMEDKEDNEQKRSKARNALKRALSGKSRDFSFQRTNSKNEKLDVKFANVKKLNVQTHAENKENEQRIENNFEVIETNHPDVKEKEDTHFKRHYIQAPKKDSVEKRFITDKQLKTNLNRFSSFSSTDSFSSRGSIRGRHADVSLTSGELTSLSSQADADTDDFATDVDAPAKEVYMKKVIQSRLRKNVDSGFDSESSEISSHGPQSNYLSDDSAFHETKARRSNPRKQDIVVTDIKSSSSQYSKQSIPMSEKTFCLTGINSRIVETVTDSPDLEIECLPDYNVELVEGKEEFRPTSSLSRIIEVSSASPDQTKEMDFDNEIERVSSPRVDKMSGGEIFNPSYSSRPKTPSSNRPKTPGISKEMRGPNVMASSHTADAARRYRELVKKGVPLRVSEVAVNENPNGSSCQLNEENSETQRLQPEDEKLFINLDSQGFFQTERDKKLIPGRTYGSLNRKSRIDKGKKNKLDGQQTTLGLDDIVRESPVYSNNSPVHKSPNGSHLSPNHAPNNGILDDSFTHVSENEVAMFNQPQSEDSETSSTHNGTLGNSNQVSPNHNPQNPSALMVDAELYIDRLYSKKQTPEHNQPHPPILDPDFDSPLLLENGKPTQTDQQFDIQPVHDHGKEEERIIINVPLKEGVSDKHVTNCQKLTSALHLVSFNDLLPATHEGFNMMKIKLKQAGQLGDVGSQLLDIVNKCWLSETPPTSFDLVMQLMDPVKETEL